MAGKAEKVTPIVHELMHIGALDQRSGAFFGPNKIDCDYEKQAVKDCPRQDFADRNCYR